MHLEGKPHGSRILVRNPASVNSIYTQNCTISLPWAFYPDCGELECGWNMLSRKKKTFNFKEKPSSSMVWKDFKCDHFIGSRILCGNLSEVGNHTKVPNQTLTASAVTAIAYSKCLPVQNWTQSSLNYVTSRGFELAKRMEENSFMDINRLMGNYTFGNCNKTVMVTESARKNATTDSSNQKFSLLPSASSVMKEFALQKIVIVASSTEPQLRFFLNLQMYTSLFKTVATSLERRPVSAGRV